MFEIKDNVQLITDDIERIAKNYYNLSVVNAVEKGSKLGANLMISVIIMALAFFFLLFAFIGLGFWLGQLLGGTMYGFFVVAGFLLLILLLLIALKGKVIVPLFRNIIIKNIYD